MKTLYGLSAPDETAGLSLSDTYSAEMYCILSTSKAYSQHNKISLEKVKHTSSTRKLQWEEDPMTSAGKFVAVLSPARSSLTDFPSPSLL